MYTTTSLENAIKAVNKLICFLQNQEELIRALKETNTLLIANYKEIINLLEEKQDLKDSLDSGCFDFSEKGEMLLRLKAINKRINEIKPLYETYRDEQVNHVTDLFNQYENEIRLYIEQICLKGQESNAMS